MKKIEAYSEKISMNGITYGITESSNENVMGPTFGIYSFVDKDRSESAKVENIFFTRDEALKYCEWLAQNEVYPITLVEVLKDMHS